MLNNSQKLSTQLNLQLQISPKRLYKKGTISSGLQSKMALINQSPQDIVIMENNQKLPLKLPNIYKKDSTSSRKTINRIDLNQLSIGSELQNIRIKTIENDHSQAKSLKQMRLQSIQQISGIYGVGSTPKINQNGMFNSKSSSNVQQQLQLDKNMRDQYQFGDQDLVKEIDSINVLTNSELNQQLKSESNVIRDKIDKEDGQVLTKQKSKLPHRHIKKSEIFSIWDNKELEYRGIDFQELENKDQLQQFLQFYKMRFGGYPGAPASITNEEVIKTAVNITKVNKKMFRKYFPSKQVIFEDEADYSSAHQLQKDPNFLKFISYVNQLKSTEGGQESIKRRVNLPNQIQFGDKLISRKKLQARIKKDHELNPNQ